MSKNLSAQMVTVTEGLISNVSDVLRGPNQARVLNNVRQLKRGVFTSTQSGWIKQNAAAFNSGAQILEFGVFIDTAGTSTMLFQAGNTLYSYDLVIATGITGMTSLATTYAPCMRMFSPYAGGAPIMVYVNGDDEPKKVTSVTTSAVLQINGASPGATGAPLPVKTYSKPQFCEPFLDRMVYARFRGSPTNTFMDVLITNSGTPGTVTQSTPLVATDGGIFTIPAKLGAITALKTLKLNNQTNDQVLIVGCSAGIAVITGTDATNFQMRILTDEYGIVSNRAIVTIMNDLFFLATDGIRRFSGVASNASLLNAAMTFNQQDIIRRINFPQADKAFASHHRLTQEIEFWFPVDSSTVCNGCLLANYNTDATTYESVEPIWMTRDGTTVSSMIDFFGIEYGGGYDGYIQKHHSGNLYDTNPITFTITPAFMSPGDAMFEMQIDHMLVITEGVSQNFIMNSSFFQDMGQGRPMKKVSATPTDFPMQAIVNAGIVLGSWILGSSGFASGAGVKVIPYRPMGKGRWWEASITGNQSNHAIDFIGIEYKFVPNGAKP